MDNFIIPLSEEFSNIYFIQGNRNARYPFSNSLLIGNYLIDTGVSPKIIRCLKKQFSIDKVILSHWHEDHISGNYLLKDCNFLAHLNDKPIIEDISKMIEFYGIENTPIGEDFKNLIGVNKDRNVIVSKTINDKEVINIDGNLKLQIVHTPGHTAGHCIFYELNTKIAFLGDIDLTRFPYYGNIDASLIEFYESIEKLRNLDLNLVCTGHRGIIEGKNEIYEQIDKFKSIIDKRSERILQYFSERDPIKPERLSEKKVIYKNYSDFKEFELIAEVLMIQLHFDKLLYDKIIEQKDNGYVLS